MEIYWRHLENSVCGVTFINIIALSCIAFIFIYGIWFSQQHKMKFNYTCSLSPFYTIIKHFSTSSLTDFGTNIFLFLSNP